METIKYKIKRIKGKASTVRDNTKEKEIERGMEDGKDRKAEDTGL